MPEPPNSSTPERRLWDRWLWAWHVLFYGLLVWIGICVWLMDELTGGRLAGSLLGLVALGLWYGWMVVRRPRSRRSGALYLAGAVAMWLGLAELSGIFHLLTWVLAAQTFVLLPLVWAIPEILLVTALLWHHVEMAGLELLAWFLSLAVVGLVTSWQKAMVRHAEERQRLQDELASAERQAGVLEERQRLAREIHDTVAQEFTSIVLHLEAAEGALPASDGKPAGKHLEQARRTARHGLAEARRLVQALRPELLEGRSLAEALERLAERWSKESGIAADVKVAGNGQPLPREVEATLLRAAQEALANVRKHAGATRVTVTYSHIGDLAVLDVQDDGRGFAADDATAGRPDGDGSGGFGLIAMRERAQQLGGRLSVESAPGDGTTLMVELPAHFQS